MVGAYNVQMKRWYIEDTVSSAIGRCASVVLGVENKASKESMEQVEHMPKAFIEHDPWSKPIFEEGFTTAKTAVDEIKATLGEAQASAAPVCAHGHMVWRTGDKAGKAWGGYMCVEKNKANQCTPRWFVLASDGQWKPQV